MYRSTEGGSFWVDSSGNGEPAACCKPIAFVEAQCSEVGIVATQKMIIFRQTTAFVFGICVVSGYRMGWKLMCG